MVDRISYLQLRLNPRDPLEVTELAGKLGTQGYNDETSNPLALQAPPTPEPTCPAHV